MIHTEADKNSSPFTKYLREENINELENNDDLFKKEDKDFSMPFMTEEFGKLPL